jgi:hypothetical protein
MKTKPLSIAIVMCALAGIHRTQGATAVVVDPSSTSLGLVKGADPGEGLDLDGKFPYALSIGADPSLDLKIRDATFKGLIDAEVPGATLTAGNRIANWYVVDYGSSADDDNLELATSSIRWSDANAAINKVTLSLTENIKVVTVYKLQLMFGEQCCNRGFDVFVNGTLIVKDFNPGVQHEGVMNGTQEALISYTFPSTKPTLEIVLDGTTASPDYPDHNAIFNAITVGYMGATVL